MSLLTLVALISGAQAAPAAALAGLVLNPTAVTGGNVSTGTVFLTEAAPVGGAVVELSSSTPIVAGVPATVIIPAGATSASFPIWTSTVTSSGTVLIVATYGGMAAFQRLGVNAQNVVDQVSITRAQYDARKRVLKVEAATSATGAVLSVYEQATGRLIGTLGRKGNRYSGEFSSAVNPVTITVVSSQGGSATARTTS